MYIFTTVYCAELEIDKSNAQEFEEGVSVQEGTPESVEMNREFLSIYQGQSRAMPIDRDN